MTQDSSRFDGLPSDVAIIGGGVVGCAAARRFALEGAKTILLERGADILSGASKANSAILHTGFDAPPDSLELACMRAGYEEYLRIRSDLNLPLVETGALVCAWTAEEEEKLAGILEKGRGNGASGLRLLSRAEVVDRLPAISPALRAAIEVPGEHVIDPWSAPLAYACQAMAHGAEIHCRAEVLSGEFRGGAWQLGTTKGPIEARTVVNCAGLFGDIVDQRLAASPDFTIKPRKGQFVVFDKAALKYVPSILLPVPTAITKGIVLTPTAFGNVLVGPTAEEQEDRERAPLDRATLEGLIARAAEIVPALGGIPVTATYAGLRPATEHKGYRIRSDGQRNLITVGGIRSTGLTAALGIARHVFELYGAMGFHHEPVRDPVCPSVPNISEFAERDWQRPDHGEIVCFCELVTLREIEAALDGPLHAGDFGGLRRRTRANMGRCQGFYCGARLAEITRGRLAGSLSMDAEDGR